MEEEKKYLIINDIKNAIDSLNVASIFIEKKSLLKWKWVAISIHHSLYSFCISALVNGNYDKVLTFRHNEDNDGWLTVDNENLKRLCKKNYDNRPYYKLIWYETNENPPNIPIIWKMKKSNKLIGFWSALARVMDGVYWMGHKDGMKPLVLNDDQLEKIFWFTNFVRNDLVHFIPKITIIPIDKLKECINVALYSIEFLTKESRAIINLTPKHYIFIDKYLSIIKKNIEYDCSK